jgi:hypothetical protein
MTEKNYKCDPFLGTSISQGTDSYHAEPPGYVGLTITLQNRQLQGTKDSHYDNILGLSHLRKHIYASIT